MWFGPSTVYCPACGHAQTAHLPGEVAWELIAGGAVATFMCECKCFIQTHHDGRQRNIDGAVPTPTIKVELSSWQLALSPRTTRTSQQHPHRCWQKHAILPDVFNIGRCLPLSLAQQLVGDLANAMANTCFSLESVEERLVREISQQHELA